MTDYAALSMVIEITKVAEVAGQTHGFLVTYNDPSAGETVTFWLQLGDQNGLGPLIEARVMEMIDTGALTIQPAT